MRNRFRRAATISSLAVGWVSRLTIVNGKAPV